MITRASATSFQLLAFVSLSPRETTRYQKYFFLLEQPESGAYSPAEWTQLMLLLQVLNLALLYDYYPRAVILNYNPRTFKAICLNCNSTRFPSSETQGLLVRTNLLLTEREGRTGEYWPEVIAVRTERSEARTKPTEGQYSSVRLELARLVSRLFYCIYSENFRQ